MISLNLPTRPWIPFMTVSSTSTLSYRISTLGFLKIGLVILHEKSSDAGVLILVVMVKAFVTISSLSIWVRFSQRNIRRGIEADS